jgi:hypothetical protein
MKTKVFISYGRRDASSIALKLVDELTRRDFDVWLDQSNLRAGRSWEEQIVDGLSTTQAVIALLSPHSTRRDDPQSGDSVCLDEIAFARYGQTPVPIVPVLAVRGAAIPLTIYRLHYIDFVDAVNSEPVFQAQFEQLLTALNDALAGRPRYRHWDSWLDRGPDFDRFLYSKHRGFIGRDWLFKKIDKWERTTSEPALLIKGDPGIGKSAIIAELAFGRLPGSTTVAYCCQWDVTVTLRPATFVRALAYQFASRIQPYADAIENSEIRMMLERAELDPPSAFELAVLAPLGRMNAPQEGRFFLCIDALDEAATFKEGPDIVDLLSSRIDRLPPWIRVIATTRNDKAVLRQLAALRGTEIDAGGAENMKDVAAYVAHQFAQPEVKSALSNSKPLKTAAQLKKSLVEHSKGSFLFAEHFIKGMVRGQVQPNQVDDLPPGLNGTYESYLQRAFPDASTKQAIRPILEILCAANEPIPVSVVASAIGLTTHALMKSLAPLAPFIHANLLQKDPRLAFWHKSFPDFLTGIENADSDFGIDPTQGHRKLGAMFVTDASAQTDPRLVVERLPDYLRRQGLAHLALSGSFFDGLSSEQVERMVFCSSWGSGSVSVGGLPLFAPAFVWSAVERARFADIEQVLRCLWKAASAHYRDAGLVVLKETDEAPSFADSFEAKDMSALNRAFVATGLAVSIIDQVRARDAAPAKVASLLESASDLHSLVSGISGYLLRHVSGYFEDHAYALDIMFNNLKNGQRAQTWGAPSAG